MSSATRRSPRFVGDDEIAGALTLRALIPAMRATMIDFSRGRVDQPPRRLMELRPHGGYFASMPAATADAVGARLVTFCPRNAGRGLATHRALVALFRPDTGEPLAVMDGGLITALRSAAVTAAYVDAVAPRTASSLAILGAGKQGRSHARALSLVRDFRDIRIWNRTPARAARLAGDCGGRAVTREDAVRGADVVVLATAATEPVIDGRWLKAGATVASVGWSGPDTGELDAWTMAQQVIVDSREGALLESGNVRRFGARIHAELGEVLDGSRTVDTRGIAVFESIGMACQDLAAARLVWDALHANDD